MGSARIRQIVSEKLKVADPELYEECEKLADAPIKDLTLLPKILQLIFKSYAPNSENAAFILALVYFLYAPYKLHFANIRSDNGIRDVVCAAFKWNDRPTVNYYQARMVVYYKNPRWAAKVKELAEEIIRLINQQDYGNQING